MTSTFRLRRRLDALEITGFPARPTVDGRATEAFIDFIAETFGRDRGSYADAAARLVGLPNGRYFQQFCAARFDMDAYPGIAKTAYGDDWRIQVDQLAEGAAERCRATHGDGWASVMADRMRIGDRSSAGPASVSIKPLIATNYSEGD